MTQSGSTASQEEPVEVGLKDFLARIYRLFYNKFFGLVLIMVMAALTMMGTLIEQAPAGTMADPASKEQFLASARQTYGGWVSVFSALGVFNMFSSPLFLVVTALLALSIIACTVHRLPLLWRNLKRPRTHVSDRFFAHAPNRFEMATATEVEEAYKTAKDVFVRRRYRVLNDEAAPHSFYADRFAWGPFGTVIAHLAFVLILVAFVVSAYTSFEQNVNIGVGDKAGVPGTPFTVTAHDFKDSYYADGRPSDYVSNLAVEKNGKQVTRGSVRVNEPLRYDGYRFHQMSFGIAARIKVTDQSGKALFAGAVPLQWKSADETNSIGKVTPPKTGKEILIVAPASGAQSEIPAGSVQVEVYANGQDQPSQVFMLDPGKSGKAEGLTVLFDREMQYTGVSVRKDPGAVLIWIGTALIMAGLIMTFACTHRRMWVRVDETEEGTRIRVASADKTSSLSTAPFAKMARALYNDPNNDVRKAD